MKFRMLLSFSFLAFSQQTLANDEFETVCDYVPQGTFQQPKEIVLSDPDTYPKCPAEVTVVDSTYQTIIIPMSDGNDIIVGDSGPTSEIYTLLYEVPGGY